jgi:acyl-ACP thioesterase
VAPTDRAPAFDVEFFPEWNRLGRCYTYDDVVGLGDADARGVLRLDGLGRLLQSVSARDSDESGFLAPWVLRRLTVAFDGEATFGEHLRLSTWCSGTGSAVAERRTRIEVTGARDGGPSSGARIEAAALWVHLDERGMPAALTPRFDEIYGPSAAGRTVRSRLRHPPPEPLAGVATNAAGRTWPLRTTDIDMVGHVHNVAYWDAVEACRRAAWGDAPIAAAELEYRGGIDLDDAVDLVWKADATELRVWIRVDDQLRGSAVVTAAPH